MSSARQPGLRVVLEADGGSRGNPGPAGYGAVVFDGQRQQVLAERKEAIGIETNNVAEYRGLIAGLSAAAELGATEVEVRMDSKLVIEQMSGRWQVKHPSMRPLVRQANELVDRFDQVSFSWIPRAQNAVADRLANEAMDAAAGVPELTRPAAPAQLDLTAEAGLPSAEAEPTNNNSAWISVGAARTRFVLVRHGVTVYSVERRFAGRSDLELTEDGQRQAAQAAGRVAELGSIDALVSSPLRRTRQTAGQLAERLDLALQIEGGLIETDFGSWDGYTFDEIRAKWPAELASWLVDESVAPPGGESWQQVTSRVRRARDRLLDRYQGKTVAVVSHVSPIKILVQLALAAPPAAVHRMFLSPASITVIDYFSESSPDGSVGGTAVSLQSYNDTAHLSAG